MAFEATQRVREGLAELIRLVDSGGASTADARRVLAESKAFAAQVAVLQADAAALVAAGERHGDGGTGVLARTVGLSRKDAAVQVKAVAEVADGGVIPPSVLEEHFCNAKIVGIVFSSKGRPLWRGPALQRPTRAQMDALIARYGG